MTKSQLIVFGAIIAILSIVGALLVPVPWGFFFAIPAYFSGRLLAQGFFE